MDSNSFIFFFVLIFFGFFFNRYFDLILNKYKPGLLIDNQFKKPQAFHEHPVSTSGGLAIFLSFLILSLYFFLEKKMTLSDHDIFIGD